MFKKCILIIIPLLALVTVPALSYETFSRQGAGVVFGDPLFGVTGKYWLDRKSAVDLSIGSPIGNQSVQLHGSYLYHDFNLIKVKEVKLPIYFGGGPRFRFGNSKKNGSGFGFALRPVVGIAAIFADDKLEGFFELAPLILQLAPEFELNISAAIGLRYYFKM